MASEPSWPDGQSGTYSPSLLDVLHANQFEGQSLPPELLRQTEKSFYSGAPPNWLNFHISEQSGSAFIKRDGYAALVEKICESRRKFPGISTVKLLHQPGCGGTTLAMTVLWDLRKDFKCAVLPGSTTNITKVAEEVVQLFTAGGCYKTVLLLVNDEAVLEKLKDGVRLRIAKQEVPITTRIPVVILLRCVRKDEVQHSENVVLRKRLSEREERDFNAKKEELRKEYGEQCDRFHGFNIMQTNFSPAYIKEACSVFQPAKRANGPREMQLASFLSLLNAYVPDSFLLESQTQDFFQHGGDCHPDFSLEDRMEPFSHLIVTFQRDERSDKKVRMAHPLIARRCTELLAESGVTRSHTAINLLTQLCEDQSPPLLVVGFVKDMLTKRGPKQRNRTQGWNNATETREDPEMFARLILDIQLLESKGNSASVLEVASNLFDADPFLPQALARFYYIELKDYEVAEMWAEGAKQRSPRNSFVADTLGQVHKNHLKNTGRPIDPHIVLKLASKAIEAFKDEEKLAENECDAGADTTGDHNTRVSHHFNTRGQFGYLQLCNDLFRLLVSQNDTWRDVLTKKVSLHSALESLGDQQLIQFKDLIDSLRDEIERKCAFFNRYLTYSRPKLNDDPDYISEGTSECYKNFVGSYPSADFKQKGGDLIQKLKGKLVDTSAGVLSCLERECNNLDLKEVTTWWEQIFLQTESINCIVALVVLRNKSSEVKQKMPVMTDYSPELHMLALLLCWPVDGEARCVLDLGKLIERMKGSFEVAYGIHLRTRYLRPLFFMGNGKGLDRIVHRKVLENLLLEQNQETEQDWSNNWIVEKIFQDPKVHASLVKVEGVVRNYRLFATVGGGEIELEADNQDSLWRPRQVSFYLGFSIRGPVAFAVQTKPPAKEENSRMNCPEREQKETEDDT